MLLVTVAAQRADTRQQRGEHVGLEHRVQPVESSHRALHAHACVHVLPGQWLAAAVGEHLVFHEHVVPDLHVFAAAATGLAAGSAQRPSGVEEHLRVRAARAAAADRPPPVLVASEGKDALVHPGVDPGPGELLLPQRDRFPVAGHLVVPGEHRDIQPLRVEPQPLFAGEEFPAPGDRLGFEVVAQGPVAQHLEEGQVGRVADQVDVVGAQTALPADQAPARRMWLAQQIRHQRLHAGGDEQRGRVVFGHQRRRGDEGASALCEKGEVFAAQQAGRKGKVFHGCHLPERKKPAAGWLRQRAG